jgi:16S rRNA (guanine966-N2)-methyltransferase
MRVISGILKSRVFDVPDIVVRPTKAQVREAIFSSLGSNCSGWDVLDLFAGAGSLGIEAWSRGATSVDFVEKHPQVWNVLQKNIQKLESGELGATRCVKGDFLHYLNQTSKQYDLIFADPPYDLPDAMEQTLNAIVQHSVLTSTGIVVYELRASGTVVIPPEIDVVREKVYGKTRVLMLKVREG